MQFIHLSTLTHEREWRENVKTGTLGRFCYTLVFLFSDSIAACNQLKCPQLSPRMDERKSWKSADCDLQGRGVWETISPGLLLQLGTLTEPGVHLSVGGLSQLYKQQLCNSAVPPCAGNTCFLIAELNSAPGLLCSSDQKISDYP